MREKIIRALKTVYDPEIPVDIWELGLIYNITINDDDTVKVVMTLTSPNCPVAEELPLEVERAVQSVEGVKSVDLDLTFEPPFEPSMMSEEARFSLGMM
jgi:FeS assembly SUF system protein